MKFALPLAMNATEDYCELAKSADQSGWHYIAVSDHLIYPEKFSVPYPYTADGKPRFKSSDDWPEPWVIIAAMAAVTQQIKFYNNVFVLPTRNPILVAKEIATAAVVSRDRVALGVGLGWMPEEFAVSGQPFQGRGKRTDEMLAVMKKLWAGGMVEHHGANYDFSPLQINPVPKKMVPIFVGGISELAMRRAAEHDGWISDLHSTAELASYINIVRSYRKELSKDHQPFEILCFGATDAVGVDGYRRMGESGATVICTIPWFALGRSAKTLQAKKDAIVEFGDKIISRF
jgi:probable F420-dependent oxidoreductase